MNINKIQINEKWTVKYFYVNRSVRRYDLGGICYISPFISDNEYIESFLS